MRAPRYKALRGVCSAGFNTQVHPAARAAPHFITVNMTGKFQGTICATTPTGSFTVYVKNGPSGNV